MVPNKEELIEVYEVTQMFVDEDGNPNSSPESVLKFFYEPDYLETLHKHMDQNMEDDEVWIIRRQYLHRDRLDEIYKNSEENL